MPDTPDTRRPSHDTILAFDFGLRRIGVAVGQSVTMSASPLGVVANSDSGPDFEAIERLIREWRPTRLVVGLPRTASGEPGSLKAPVDAFVRALARFDLDVETVDERYTSLEAEAALKNARAAGTRGRITKEAIDSAAAVFIAERFLTERSKV